RPGGAPGLPVTSCDPAPSTFVSYHRHRTIRERIRHIDQTGVWVAVEETRARAHLDGRHHGSSAAVDHRDRAGRRVAAPAVGDVDPAVVGIEQHAVRTTAHGD